MSTFVYDAVVLTATADVQGAVVPASTVRKITKMTAYNSTGGAVTLEVYVVPATLSADTTHRIMSVSIAAGKTYLCPEIIGMGIKAGGTIYAKGLALSFSYTAIEGV